MMRTPVKLPAIEGDYSQLMWGTYGKGGKDPLKYVKLVECDKDHLEAILKNCPHIHGSVYETAIRTMLETT